MEPKKQSEADFIAEQQEHARAAISQTIVDMKQAVVQSVDVAEWTRQHPWILMGAAAAVGVVAGRLITPSKEEKLTEFFEEKWEKIKDKFTPAAPAEAAARSVADAPAEKPSFVGSVLKETMKTVGPMLLGLITSYMEQQHNKDEANNGHHGNGKHTEDEPVEGPLKDC